MTVVGTEEEVVYRREPGLRPVTLARGVEAARDVCSRRGAPADAPFRGPSHPWRGRCPPLRFFAGS